MTMSPIRPMITPTTKPGAAASIAVGMSNFLRQR